MLERRVSRRFILRAVGLGTVGTVVVPPLLHIDNTLRVFRSVALGEKVDCAQDKEGDVKDYPFDAIVVPGAGLVTTPQGVHVPSHYQQLRLDGAAIAYSKNLAPKIILLDGAKGPSEDGLTSKNYLEESLRKLRGENFAIPDDAIIIENRSINTATNMKELRRIVSEQKIKKVLIVTNDYHERRVTLFSCEYGVPSSSASAEELIIGTDSEREDEIHGLYNDPEMGAPRQKKHSRSFGLFGTLKDVSQRS